jgi:hypothetical protein
VNATDQTNKTLASQRGRKAAPALAGYAVVCGEHVVNLGLQEAQKRAEVCIRYAPHAMALRGRVIVQ